MKYLAGYLQHQNQHRESLMMYDKICKVRRAKLQLSAEELASDQINHGIAMFKAYKYKIEQPDSPRIAPDQKLLLDSVCCIYVTRFVC
jgi:hypothetical protein